MIIHSIELPASEYVSLYSGPQAFKTAVVVLGAEDSIFGRQDIIICRFGKLNADGSNLFDTISVTHRSCDPLCYNLPQPREIDGWRLGLRLQSTLPSRRQNPRMFPLMFYAYQLFQSSNQFNTIFQGGRLFQSYVVDQLRKVGAERLEYLHHNRVALRAADYTSLRKQLEDSLKHRE